MKARASLLPAVAFITSIMLVGCGSNAGDKYVGKWSCNASDIKFEMEVKHIGGKDYSLSILSPEYLRNSVHGELIEDSIKLANGHIVSMDKKTGKIVGSAPCDLEKSNN